MPPGRCISGCRERYYDVRSAQTRHAVTWSVQGTVGEDSLVTWEDVLQPTPHPTPSHKEITVIDKLVVAGGAGLSAAAAFFLVALSGPGSWSYFVAGGVCAATSHAIPTPVDVVKVREKNIFGMRFIGRFFALKHLI